MNVLTLKDFEGGMNIEGFGLMSQADLDELNKALGTGTVGDAYGAHADGSALRPESLEGTLKVVIAQDRHIKFWKDIFKKPAYSTVEEFNVLDSYGGEVSPFFVEGGLPNEEDSNYVRRAGLVKFLGTTRVITHPMTLVRSAHGDVVARETNNGTLWLLQQMERSLFKGNSAIDPLAFDGIEAQILTGLGGDAEQIIDMRGEPLTEEVCEDASNIILDNYGFPSKMYLTPKTHSDFSKLFYARQRVNFGSASGHAGMTVPGFSTGGGTWTFEPDVFLRPLGAPPATAKPGAPDTPSITTAATGDANSLLPAATYTYRVTAVNSKGESAPCALESQAVSAGEKAQITITRVVSDPPARSYRIYRGVSGGADPLFMREVADPGTDPNFVVEDLNMDIPGTSTAYLLDLDSEQSLAFKQLAPLMKLPLARISAAERFMILLYGMPLVYNPKRNVMIKNIGAVGPQVLRDLFPTRDTSGKIGIAGQ